MKFKFIKIELETGEDGEGWIMFSNLTTDEVHQIQQMVLTRLGARLIPISEPSNDDG